MVQVIEGLTQITGAGEPQPRSSATHNAVANYLEHSRSSSRVRAPLHHWLRRGIWMLMTLVLLWTLLLVAIVTGDTGCDSLICSVATLNHHAPVLLVLATVCLAGLAGLLGTTKAWSRCNGTELAALGAAVAAGGAALIGIVALVLGAVIVLMFLEAFFAALTASH